LSPDAAPAAAREEEEQHYGKENEHPSPAGHDGLLCRSS
jgi:hypothetical protein